MTKEKLNPLSDEKIKSPSPSRKKTYASPRVGSSSDEGQTVEEVLEKAVQRQSGSVRGSIVDTKSRNSGVRSPAPEDQSPGPDEHQEDVNPENAAGSTVSTTVETGHYNTKRSINPVAEEARPSVTAESIASGAPRKSVRLSVAPDSDDPPAVTMTSERRTLVSSHQSKEFNADEEDRISNAIEELEKSLHAMAEAQQERLSNSSGGKKSTSGRRSTNAQRENASIDEPPQDAQTLEPSEEDCEPAEEVPFMSAFLDTILGNDQLPCNVCDITPENPDESDGLGLEEYVFKTIDLVNDILKQLVQFVLEKVEKAKSSAPSRSPSLAPSSRSPSVDT